MEKFLERIKSVMEQAAKALSIPEYTELLDEVCTEAEARLECLKNEHGSV